VELTFFYGVKKGDGEHDLDEKSGAGADSPDALVGSVICPRNNPFPVPGTSPLWAGLKQG
jgi:hypothetical protein